MSTLGVTFTFATVTSILLTVQVNNPSSAVSWQAPGFDVVPIVHVDAGAHMQKARQM